MYIYNIYIYNYRCKNTKISHSIIKAIHFLLYFVESHWAFVTCRFFHFQLVLSPPPRRGLCRDDVVTMSIHRVLRWLSPHLFICSWFRAMVPGDIPPISMAKNMATFYVAPWLRIHWFLSMTASCGFFCFLHGASICSFIPSYKWTPILGRSKFVQALGFGSGGFGLKHDTPEIKSTVGCLSQLRLHRAGRGFNTEQVVNDMAHHWGRLTKGKSIHVW